MRKNLFSKSPELLRIVSFTVTYTWMHDCPIFPGLFIEILQFMCSSGDVGANAFINALCRHL